MSKIQDSRVQLTDQDYLQICSSFLNEIKMARKVMINIKSEQKISNIFVCNRILYIFKYLHE